MEVTTFRITGIRPMLMNSPESMGENTGNVSVKKKIYLKSEEAEKRLYKTPDGKALWFPAQAFKSALLEGATGRKIGRNAARSIVKGAVFCAEETVILVNAKTNKPIKPSEFSIDSRTVVVSSGFKKNRVMRHRPKISDWACDVAFELDDIIAQKEVLELLNLSGRMIGVGDYRPFCGGSFGRFTATLSKKK